MDECADGTATCHALATCQNSPGTYSCNCNEGYEGNGVDSCTGIYIRTSPLKDTVYMHVAFVLKVIIIVFST